MEDTLSQLQAGQLQGSTTLKLSCGLTNFPEAIYNLTDTLEILDLSGNALSTLPDDLGRFKKLRILFCSSNQFTHLPAVLGKCDSLSMIGFKANQITHIPENAIPTKNLRWFILTDNALTKIPDALGQCKKLKKLMLAGNQLATLPDSLANCKALELLRISANQLKSLPSWLFDLPTLSWLAYAGNPFSNTVETARIESQSIHTIDWLTLTLHQVLGEGASGITYQATIRQPTEIVETVAVKLFKGHLTSDGLPSCEMHANVLVGSQANLVGVKGIVRNHPDGTMGIVMPLLDDSLNILANPPNFATCSRDVYASKQTFTMAQLLTIINGVANAMHHLHQQGLMHGDCYAHNILWNNESTVLSDLGAASFLPQDQVLSNQLQQIESCAFGILLAELLVRSPLKAELNHPLWQLQKTCTASQPKSRPLFNEITASLQAIKC